MNLFSRPVRAIFSTASVLWLVTSITANNVSGAEHNLALRAGAAIRVVNPTRPSVTIGHRVMKRFSNVYADICVQVMVIEDAGGQRIVWMAMDFCILRHEFVDRIKKEVQVAHGVDPRWICINASHTHSAPPLTAEEAVLPEHVDEQYSERVLSEAVVAVGDAIGRLEPARLRYAADRCQVGINRRRLRDGSMTMLPNAEGIVDHRVQVVAAESYDTGRLIGVAIKYACHPVTVVGLGLGSDYPGYMRKIFQERHPEAVPIFLQGCGANVRIRAVNEDLSGWVSGDLAMAERFGRELADAVDRALNKQSPDAVAVAGPIGASYEEIQLPVKPLGPEEYRAVADRNDAMGNWGRRFAEMIDQGMPVPETIPYRVQAFRLGEGETRLTVIALDGEVFAEYGLNLDRMLDVGRVIALGYSNGVVTYLPTARALAEGGYEPSAYRYFLVPGPFPESVEQRVLNAAIRVDANVGMSSAP